MKKTIILLIALISIMSVSALRPEVWVSGFDANAQVGKDFDLTVRLTNLEPRTCANNIIMNVQGGYPFIMKGVSSVPVGDICSADDLSATVPMSIDPAAKGGTYQLTITTNYETSTLAQFSSTSVINVYVSGTPALNAQIVSSSPLDVYPGDTATLTFVVQNDGTFQAQSVEAELSAQLPLDVIWSKSKDALGLIDAKQGQNVDFALEVPKDAPSGIYPVALKLTYLDENLQQVSKIESFNMVVKDQAQFEALTGSSDSLFRNQNGRVVNFALRNTGTDIAKRLKIRLLPNYPFSTDGTVRYIDSLAPGAEKDIQFVVNTDKSATAGTYGLDLLVDFEDEQGKKFEDTTDIALTIQQESTFRAVFINYWYLWTVALIVLIAVVLRRVRKK